ncbi:MAG: hypothetical protein Kow0077_03860 [Anaerolineae bacterium]
MILVTGATGFIGRTLVPRLAADGWPVRVFVPGRPGAKPALPYRTEVDVFVGNPYDLADVAAAMDRVHTVYHLASAQWWGSVRDLERVDVNGTKVLVEAARKARTGRLIVMSHLGAASASAYPLLRAKGRVEEIVRASGVPFTIVRSGIVFGEQDRFVNGVAMLLHTNPLVFLQPGEGENLLHPVYISDLVAALVACMENLETVDRLLEVGGPEYVTFNEMVRTVMRVTGTGRTIISIPPHTLRFLTRLFYRLVRRWPATPQWFDIVANHHVADLNSLPDSFGIKPVRFEDTLLTYMPGRRYGFELLRFLVRRHRPGGI